MSISLRIPRSFGRVYIDTHGQGFEAIKAALAATRELLMSQFPTDAFAQVIILRSELDHLLSAALDHEVEWAECFGIYERRKRMRYDSPFLHSLEFRLLLTRNMEDNNGAISQEMHQAWHELKEQLSAEQVGCAESLSELAHFFM